MIELTAQQARELYREQYNAYDYVMNAIFSDIRISCLNSAPFLCCNPFIDSVEGIDEDVMNTVIKKLISLGFTVRKYWLDSLKLKYCISIWWQDDDAKLLIL